MKELFDQIMSIDHRANERLNEAVRRKEEAVRKVLEEKQDQKLRLHHLTEPFTKICVQERINHLRILIPAQTFR